MREYGDWRVTPPMRVTSPTWGPPPPCKQAERACLRGVEDPGLVGWFLLFSRSGGHKTKETYPTRLGSPTQSKQALNYHISVSIWKSAKRGHCTRAEMECIVTD